MKKIFFAAIVPFLISGCASKNAFENLQLSTEQEKAIENTRSAKMTSEELVGGIFSAIYLNNIYKNLDPKKQYFYVSAYCKTDTSGFKTTLNGNLPLETQKLPIENKYSHLTLSKNDWSTNLLISFETKDTDDLNLSIDNGQFSSGQLKFVKDSL